MKNEAVMQTSKSGECRTTKRGRGGWGGGTERIGGVGAHARTYTWNAPVTNTHLVWPEEVRQDHVTSNNC